MLDAALLHPTVIILVSAAAMVASYRVDWLFRVIATSVPLFIFASISLITSRLDAGLGDPITTQIDDSAKYWIQESVFRIHLEFMNLRFISLFQVYTLLISVAITIILFIANLYTLSIRQRFYKSIVIAGSLYAGFAYMALFSGDMIFWTIAVELMMVSSSVIIFLGGKRDSYRAAKRYFITHLLSGNMIAIGIIYLIAQGQAWEIVNISAIFSHSNFGHRIAAMMILTGLTINIAAFPFSGWMVNGYRSASPSGFLYLICFTTKISIIALLKLFSGLVILEYIAVAMIIYGSWKSIFENSLFSILCLLSIIQMGFMLIAISDGSKVMLSAVYFYLFLHMLYKALLSLIVACMAENIRDLSCNNIYKIGNWLIWLAMVIAILSMTNVPLSSSFMIKSYVSNAYLDNAIYYIINALSIITIISLPFKKYFGSQKSVTLDLTVMVRFAISFMSLIVLFTTFALPILAGKQSLEILTQIFWPTHLLSDVWQFDYISLLNQPSLQQMFILIVALFTSSTIHIHRINSKSLNVIDSIGEIFMSCYKYASRNPISQEDKEDWRIVSLERQLMRRLRSAHNQQTAILIVFFIFIVMMFTFITGY